MHLGKQNHRIRKAAFNKQPCQILGVCRARLCCWVWQQVEEEIVKNNFLARPAYACTYTVIRRSISFQMLDNPSPQKNTYPDAYYCRTYLLGM
jgi:hypothetical protein